MAFDIQKYLSSRGSQGIDNTPEGIREAATALTSGKYDGLFSNSSYKDWAQTALKALDEGGIDSTWGGGNAFSWISGAMQPSAAKRVFGSYQTNLQEFQQSYQNAAENLANITDFSKLSPDEQAKVLASDTYKQALAKVQSFEDQAKSYLTAGIQVATPTLTKDANGNFTSNLTTPGYGDNSQGTTSTSTNNMGKTGEPLGIRQADNGTFEVYGVTSGKVYQSGLADRGAAISAQTTIQSGATPGQMPAGGTGTSGATGASAAGTGGATTSGYKSSVLDAAGVNYNGLTDSEIKDLENVYSSAGNSSDVMNKVFAMQDITTDDTKKFLDQAREFITGKGSAYEQSFTRVRENYERTLENNALNRQQQMDQEKLALQAAQEANATSAADTGTAFSGIRAKAEAKTAEQARNIAESSRRAFNFDTGTYQRGTEEYLGSKNLTGAKLPDIQGVENPTLTPGIRGSLERAAETDVQQKAQELQGQAQNVNKEILAGEGGVSLY